MFDDSPAVFAFVSIAEFVINSFASCAMLSFFELFGFALFTA
jgi:hypothetical protein